VLAYEVVNRTNPPIELTAFSTGVRYLIRSAEVERELGSAAALPPAERETVVATQADLPEDFRSESAGSESGSFLCWARFTDAKGFRWEAVGAPGVSKVRYRRID